jgi:hypothetical protein
MMDEPNDFVLEYLRYIRQAVDDLKVEFSGFKLRQTATEQSILALRRDTVSLEEAIVRQTIRFDGIEKRLERIERRLDLVDAP